MAHVDPIRCNCFRNSYRTAADDIAEGLSLICVASSNDHWETWSYFFEVLSLVPLIISYQDPFPILNAFTQQYRTGKISIFGRVVCAQVVEDSVRLVGQALMVLEVHNPWPINQGEVDIRLSFKYPCCSKQDPPTNWLNQSRSKFSGTSLASPQPHPTPMYGGPVTSSYLNISTCYSKGNTPPQNRTAPPSTCASSPYHVSMPSLRTPLTLQTSRWQLLPC